MHEPEPNRAGFAALSGSSSAAGWEQWLQPLAPWPNPPPREEPARLTTQARQGARGRPGRALARPRALRRGRRAAASCWSRSRRRSRPGCKTLLMQALRFDRAAHRTTPAPWPTRLLDGTLALLVVVLPFGVAMAVAAVVGRHRDRRLDLDLQADDAQARRAQPASPASAALFSKKQMVDALKASALALILGCDRRLLPEQPRRRVRRACSRCRCRRRSAAAADTLLGGMALLLLALAVFAARRRAAAEAAARRAAEDEPPGSQAGAQGARGQRRGQGQGPRADARDDASAA